jgi:hypothetical protein
MILPLSVCVLECVYEPYDSCGKSSGKVKLWLASIVYH